jgi:1-acyl-sn-glycerol-3-phosphate acyltransferase
MDVERRVVEVAEEILGPGAVPGRLEADSLALVELVLALEERLGIRLPEDGSWATLEELVADATVADRTAPDRLGNGFGRLQWAAYGAIRAPISWAYRLDVAGSEHLPPFGPAILASNHESLLDIPCLVVASPRPVWFMAKVELFRGPLASALLHRLGGFPVRRAANDLRAVRTALDVLQHGRALGMYPEGTRAAHLGPFLPGASWLALATGAPLVPVGVTGTAEALPRGSRRPRRTHVSVRFGEPIEVGREGDARARLERARAVTEDLRSSVERLLAR